MVLAERRPISTAAFRPMQALYDSAGIEPYLRLDFFHARRRLAEAAANPFCAIFATFPNLVDQVRDLGSPKLIITHIFS